jgi:alpha-N-arabinofuranosidase
MIYHNPIISGFHPDPSICRVGDDYYLITSSFEYFPGIPIFHSRDLVNWKQLGHVLTRPSQLPLARKDHYPSSLGIYAPTIRYHNGRFYVITTNVTTGINFYVHADRPEGPWSEPVIIEGWPGIDPDLFFDEDGKVYVTGTNQYQVEPEGIYQAELDIETGRVLTDRILLWYGTGGSCPEGPHIYRIGEWYYLMIAEGGTEYGHMETIARSKHPSGPYEAHPRNPIMSNRSTNLPIQATGHADLVQAPDGTWWAVFLGIRPVGYPKRHHLGRETFLAPVNWSEDGWPTIGSEGRIELTYETGSWPVSQPSAWLDKDDFDQPLLDPVWNFCRNPAEGSWSLTERPGWLTLYGEPCSLDDYASPAFVGRRQQHLKCEISTYLEFQPGQDGEEAGLTVYMNERYHYDLSLIRQHGQNYLRLRRRVGSLWKIEQEIAYADIGVELGVSAVDEEYTFWVTSQDGTRMIMGNGETSLLSTEVAGGFTGVYIAMYASGNGKPSRSPAFFDYFRYIPG